MGNGESIEHACSVFLSRRLSRDQILDPKNANTKLHDIRPQTMNLSANMVQFPQTRWPRKRQPDRMLTESSSWITAIVKQTSSLPKPFVRIRFGAMVDPEKDSVRSLKVRRYTYTRLIVVLYLVIFGSMVRNTNFTTHGFASPNDSGVKGFSTCHSQMNRCESRNIIFLR